MLSASVRLARSPADSNTACALVTPARSGTATSSGLVVGVTVVPGVGGGPVGTVLVGVGTDDVAGVGTGASVVGGSVVGETDVAGVGTGAPLPVASGLASVSMDPISL